MGARALELELLRTAGTRPLPGNHRRMGTAPKPVDWAAHATLEGSPQPKTLSRRSARREGRGPPLSPIRADHGAAGPPNLSEPAGARQWGLAGQGHSPPCPWIHHRSTENTEAMHGGVIRKKSHGGPPRCPPFDPECTATVSAGSRAGAGRFTGHQRPLLLVNLPRPTRVPSEPRHCRSSVHPRIVTGGWVPARRHSPSGCRPLSPHP
jgi:hypothetical protein